MNPNRIYPGILICLLTLVACKSYLLPLQDASTPDKMIPISQVSPLPQGDPQAGFDYLVYGGYIGTGVPWDMLEKRLSDFEDTVLMREGVNANVPYTFNVFQTREGIQAMSGNCFTCHASPLLDSMYFGLGNVESDYQKSLVLGGKVLYTAGKVRYKKDSPEWASLGTFGAYYKGIAPHIITDNPGVNPAFRLEEACVALRNPEDLTLEKKGVFEMSRFNIASDVPPLWNVAKKKALYYNGMGRGDFRKLLMQASVLGIQDSAQAREILGRFNDVVAWCASLEPPDWPYELDYELVTQGRLVFEENCQKCHGSYGPEGVYPNKIIPAWKVKTDPYYAQYFVKQSGLADWYNKSWYAHTSPASSLQPSNGYVAPPLDGIWATAPYLHNGSIPTLEGVLDSRVRPDFWEKTEAYDPEKMGWVYISHKKGKGRKVYDTSLPGYGNQGHYYGDELDTEQRKAVMAYLKTL